MGRPRACLALQQEYEEETEDEDEEEENTGFAANLANLVGMGFIRWPSSGESQSSSGSERWSRRTPTPSKLYCSVLGSSTQPLWTRSTGTRQRLSECSTNPLEPVGLLTTKGLWPTTRWGGIG